MSELNQADGQVLRRGRCPHCGSGVFTQGPREDGAQFKLCNVCLREYSVSAAAARVAHEICPMERLKEIYGISIGVQQPETTESNFP